ncbi:MAG: PCRF domain-containing protein, partial [Candidatus Binatia bacterium]
MFEKLDKVERRFDEIEQELVQPDVVSDRERYAGLMREHAELHEIVAAYRCRRDLAEQLEGALALRDDSDAEIREMAVAEVREIEGQVEAVDVELQTLLLPRDPLDRRNAILEIRAGTGGAEAGLFAADLLRMYQRYCELRGWKTEMLGLSDASMGGIKEVVMLVKGADVFGRLK